MDKLLKVMKWENLPSNWSWEDREVEEALKDVYCCLTMSTSACFDAILAGSIVIPLMSEINLIDNYLDLFEDKYRVVRSVKPKQLFTRLNEIFNTRAEYYQSEFVKLKKDIINSFNPINDTNLNVFLPKIMK